jgi:hypothetical protein
MIDFEWKPPREERLLMPGDAVLARDMRAEEELGAPVGVLFQAQVLDVQRPWSRSACIRCAPGCLPAYSCENGSVVVVYYCGPWVPRGSRLGAAASAPGLLGGGGAVGVSCLAARSARMRRRGCAGLQAPR